jgi:hypothetical protein
MLSIVSIDFLIENKTGIRTEVYLFFFKLAQSSYNSFYLEN